MNRKKNVWAHAVVREFGLGLIKFSSSECILSDDDVSAGCFHKEYTDIGGMCVSKRDNIRVYAIMFE